MGWKQGEHVALVGPTGQGKTTLALQLLPAREWVTIFATKPEDRTLSGLRREGYVKISEWPPPNGEVRRVLLWPRWRSPADTPRQAAVMRNAIHAQFLAGSWTLFTDDVQYLTDELRLGRNLATLWLQARALRISVVAATQRPRNVPRLMWSQSTHLFMWGTSDEEDLRAIGGLGGLSAKRIRAAVGALPKYHVLYVNTRDGRLAVTKARKV